MAADRAKVKALFFEAMDLPPDAVGPRLREAAAGDAELYAAVADLLDFHDDAPLLAAPPAPAPPTDPLGLEGELLDGGLRIERFIAEGGFAFVYRAVDAGEPRAVKVFKEVDPAHRDRLEAAFRREAALLADLADRVPTLVRSHGLRHWTAADGTVLLAQVLEWLEGAELAPQPGGQPLGEVVETLSPIAAALSSAHAAGVAHRDVKPGNLFVQPDGTVRLLDFGIAKVAHDRARGFASTATAGAAFTLHYAAPEQLSGQATGPWTDVYALAVVVVELLAGRHPYADQSTLETMLVLADPAKRPTPRALGVVVPDAVEAALAEALSVDPTARPDLATLWARLTEASR